MSDDEFTCENCGNTYEKAWSDDEATKEYQENFPGSTDDDPAVVCDDCYEVMMRIVPPVKGVTYQ